MDKIRAEQGLGHVSLVAGAVDWFILLLDSWGRWDTLMSLPRVGLLKFLLLPQVSPVFLFIGMLCLNRAQKEVHERALVTATSRPILHGVEQYRKTKKKSCLPYFLYIPAIAVIVGFVVVFQLWFVGPQPPLNPPPPIVDPLAYASYPDGTPGNSTTIINQSRQSLIDNEGGTVGPVHITNGSVSGGSGSGTKSSAVRITGAGINDLRLNDVHLCYLRLWDDFLDCIESYSGNEAEIKTLVTNWKQNVEESLRKQPNAPSIVVSACRQAFDEAEQQILNNTADERQIILRLREHPPFCANR